MNAFLLCLIAGEQNTGPARKLQLRRMSAVENIGRRTPGSLADPQTKSAYLISATGAICRGWLHRFLAAPLRVSLHSGGAWLAPWKTLTVFRHQNKFNAGGIQWLHYYRGDRSGISSA